VHKVIFLDIDGVICVKPTQRDEFGWLFQDDFVNNLKKIIDSTSAKIVISSSWRLNGIKSLELMWEMRDLPGEIIGITDYFQSNRGEEIQEYLRINPVDRYIIIDDTDDFFPEQKPYLIHTVSNDEDAINKLGLTKKLTEKAIKLLNE